MKLPPDGLPDSFVLFPSEAEKAAVKAALAVPGKVGLSLPLAQLNELDRAVRSYFARREMADQAPREAAVRDAVGRLGRRARGFIEAWRDLPERIKVAVQDDLSEGAKVPEGGRLPRRLERPVLQPVFSRLAWDGPPLSTLVDHLDQFSDVAEALGREKSRPGAPGRLNETRLLVDLVHLFERSTDRLHFKRHKKQIRWDPVYKALAKGVLAAVGRPQRNDRALRDTLRRALLP